jgi:hypothetical protein
MKPEYMKPNLTAKRPLILASLILLVISLLSWVPLMKVRASGTCSVPSGSYATINAALADPSCGIIQLDAGVSYTETLTINRDVTIQGETSMAVSVIQAAASPGIASTRVITVETDTTVTLEWVQIRNGVQYGIGNDDLGGGIFNEGDLSLISANVIDNESSHGGGIFNAGTLYISGAAIARNEAVFDGGGINSNGFSSLRIYGANVSDNVAGLQGGGIYTYGEVDLDFATIRRNEAAYGGGINMGGANDLNISSSTFLSNTVTVFGGGIRSNASTGLLTINETTIEGNSADIDGGGIHTTGPMNIATTSVYNNYAARDGGGIYQSGNHLIIWNTAIMSNEADGIGGGTASFLPTAYMTMTESTVAFNDTAKWAGGVYGNEANINLRNVTVTGNTAVDDGGGIIMFLGAIDIAHSTIVNNSASVSGDVAGGMSVLSTTASLHNTIILNNTSPDAASRNCWAISTTYAGSGNNIVGDGSCSSHVSGGVLYPIATPSTILNLTADLNGHVLLLTHALESNGVGHNAPVACTDGKGNHLLTDARGVPRPGGSNCDLGAYQIGAGLFLPIVLRP